MHYLLRVLLMNLILFCIMEINCHSGVKLSYILSLYSQNYAQLNHSDLTKWGFFSPNIGIQKQVVRGWRRCLRTWPPPDFLLSHPYQVAFICMVEEGCSTSRRPRKKSLGEKPFRKTGGFLFLLFSGNGGVSETLSPGTPTTNSLARSVFHGQPLRAVEAGEGKCLFLSGHIATLKK